MTGQAPLLDIPEAPVPAGGTAEWFSGGGGVTLRAAFFPALAAARGTVVVSTGRNEAIEKYFETVEDLRARGFAVVVHDWRGQGLSTRPLPDGMIGHADSFEPYVADLGRLLDLFEGRAPKPWIALGHSMGGCLTALALGQGEARFSAAVLSAPMLGLAAGGRLRFLVGWLAWSACRLGFASGYILGDRGEPMGEPFDKNDVTHDAARYARTLAQRQANPALTMGGPTWGWLEASLKASAWMKRAPGMTRIAIPVTVVSAGEERVVSNPDQARITARIPGARLVTIPGAFHELLQETDDVRARFWAVFDEAVSIFPSPLAGEGGRRPDEGPR